MFRCVIITPLIKNNGVIFMGKIKILDCTLRDGGYCNQWRFGENNILKIENSLQEASIDIIECGFLTNRVEKDVNMTKYVTVDEMRNSMPENHGNSLYVAMINYGEYEIADIPMRSCAGVDGFRIAFHKNNMSAALDYCKEIKKKGYLVFVQPMVTLNYSDTEFLDMISEVNEINPYAFYIVDSFGMMKRRDLNRLFSIVEHNLNLDICIGFHSHNNMQLAYSNAQFLVETNPMHDVIIDTSVYGMGRGAGNLNTELFADFLNEVEGHNYNIAPLLGVIDEVLNHFYQKNYWGYSLPNYLSAAYNVHPNYASFLSDKGTLTLEAMDGIFAAIDKSKAVEFDKGYIQELYEEYLSSNRNDDKVFTKLQELFIDKKVLLLAPGNSFVREQEKIEEFLSRQNRDDVLILGINFAPQTIKADYIFVSNMRRFKELPRNTENVISTSNIKAESEFKVDYNELINDNADVKDNAGLMAISLLIKLGVKDIYIAGIDGYSMDASSNYENEEMNHSLKWDYLQRQNIGIGIELEKLRNMVELHFVTTSMFDK